MTEKQFSQLLKGNQTRYKKPCPVLKNAVGVSLYTMKKYINNPSVMSVKDFCIVVQELKISQQELIEYLGGIK